MLLRLATQEKIRLTLLSAWSHEGVDLEPGLQFELRVHAERAANYEECFTRLLAEVAGLRRIKGAEVQAFYPEGWRRASNDLDCYCADADSVWRAAITLLNDGWSLSGLVLFAEGDTWLPYVGLRRATSHPLYVGDEEVDISAFASMGNLGTIGFTRSVPAMMAARTTQIVHMMLEFTERRIQTKDLLDVGLLLGGLTEDGFEDLWDALDELALWPEWLRTERSLDILPDSLLRSVPAPTGARRSGLKNYLSRLARGAAIVASRDRRLLSTMEVVGRRSLRFVGPVVDRIHPRVNLERAASQGAGLRGRVLDEHRAGELSFVVDDDTLVARTPIGSFALLGSPVVTERMRSSLDLKAL